MSNNVSLTLSFEQEFAQALLQDPVQALQSIGIEATEEILDVLKSVDVDSIVSMIETFRTNSRLAQA
jgi:hypothetical protein